MKLYAPSLRRTIAIATGTNTKQHRLIQSFHSNRFTAGACLEHSDSLKVRVQESAPHSQVQQHCPIRCSSQARYLSKGRTSFPWREPDYELSNYNNINTQYWSWNYLGCWYQTCPPVDGDTKLWSTFIPSTRHECPMLLFWSLPLNVRSGQCACLLPSLDVVAMSWAPSLESNHNSPLPVTARVGHIPYHQKLICQRLARFITGWHNMRFTEVPRGTRRPDVPGSTTLLVNKALFPQLGVCAFVSSRTATWIHVQGILTCTTTDLSSHPHLCHDGAYTGACTA